ncbi:MAG: DUF6599 family protein [Bacteroidota bacterium]
MIRKAFLTGFLFSVLCGLSAAQEITWPVVNGFKLITKYPVYTPDNLWDFINGAADGYNALGFQDLHVAEYKKGKDVIKLEIYRHSDHTMAFGIYASERSSSFRFMNLGAQGYKTGGAVNFFTGNHYVKLRTHSEKTKTLQAAESLAMRVADMLGGDTEMPALLTEFPDDGRKANTETYINENILGHQFLNKAFKASYGPDSNNFDIYLLKPGTAQEAFAAAEKYLSIAGIEPDRKEEGKYVFTDGYNGTIFLSWKDNMIVIISGLAKDQTDLADQYTSAILD